MKVFISSTYEDLTNYRTKAANAIERLNQQGIRMEVFGARPLTAANASLEELEGCELFIGIYAHRYGYIPSGSTLSVTEREYDYAILKQKEMFCFMVDEEFPWLPRHIDSSDDLVRVRAFKKKVQESIVRDTFTTSEDLAYKVAASLGRFLITKRVEDALALQTSTAEGRTQVARRAARL